jgi:hypothetical protein
MTRAPHFTNNILSRRPYLLRIKHYTLIKLSTLHKLMTPTKYHAARPHVGKADPALSLTGYVKRVCQIISKASPQPKSP